MSTKILLYTILFFVGIPTLANDSIKTKRSYFVALNATEGFSIPSKKLPLPDWNKLLHHSSATLKFGLNARGNTWQDHYYGMPYRGLGVSFYNLYDKNTLGRPISVFLFQGATLKDFNSNLSLNYELNLGASFNWDYYKVYSNPQNIVFGSGLNVHAGGLIYFNWRLSRMFDLRTGLSLTHFSNGSMAQPNEGLNLISGFVELAYQLNRPEKDKFLKSSLLRPKFERHKAHDFMLLVTARSIKVDTIDTGLNSKYINRKFKVIGASYSYRMCTTRNFSWGPGIEAAYDESVNVTAQGYEDPVTGKYGRSIRLGDVADRFTVGLSMKGELQMPGYSIFANLGYDIIHKNKKESRLYQIYGVKLYFCKNLFATFGVRSTNVSRSQYLYLNAGYTIWK